MFSHARIWRLIDDLAARNGLTASGLARRAGLDPTAFNKSKRTGVDGRLRWPSTESIAKVLDATGTALEDLLQVAGPGEIKGRRRLRPAGTEERTAGFAEADGLPLPAPPSAGYELVVLPEPGLSPLFRAGDRLIVDRDAPLQPGDRVILRLVDGQLRVGEIRDIDGGLRLASPGGSDDTPIEAATVDFMARILWVSQ